MITDSQTNFLYLADTLPAMYPEFYQRFEKTLNQNNIPFALLPNTKDVWAVDYMPVQTDWGKYVQFVYNPQYLQSKKYLKTISDVNAICKEIKIEPLRTDILLDGGNVVRWTNKAIMTDRVFEENPSYERKQLIRKLHELLEVEDIYFLPEQPGDFTGHADGMVRFVNEHTVIINDYKGEKEWFHRAFEIAIHNTGLDYIKIPYNVYGNKNNDQANGDYINYLQMADTLLVPTFGLKEDDIVIRQLESIFTGQNIATIDSNEIANDGGILNCISWNIMTDKSIP